MVGVNRLDSQARKSYSKLNKHKRLHFMRKFNQEFIKKKNMSLLEKITWELSFRSAETDLKNPSSNIQNKHMPKVRHHSINAYS